jgi:ATP adenylyltransferase
MDYLWTPWRYQYVSQAGPNQLCIFCEALKRNQDEFAFILFRGQHNFILLNRYPYTTGHAMIAPYNHVGELGQADPDTLSEMILLCQRFQRALAAVYKPDAYNLGMNLGRVAGAGVAEHLHMHVLPRWVGDTSFMTTIGETRIEPEDLGVTYKKLKAHFEK